MKVVHYINQFFGGIGGEEFADTPPKVLHGPVGPGNLLSQLLPEDSLVVATIVCGDNYAVENQQEVAALVTAQVKEAQADLFVAGPCFNAGRYGMAAGAVCAAVKSELGISVVTGMSEENPGVDVYRGEVHIVDSGDSPTGMRDVLVKMLNLGTKLANGKVIGPPSIDGYIPQGILHSEFVEKTAAQRLAAMLLSKLNGEPFEPEIPVISFEPIPVPVMTTEIARAKIALVTDGGLVPKSNPDNLPRAFSRVWGAYNIAERARLRSEDFEVAHGGYDNSHVQQDPNRLVPVDVMREMERAGSIGSLHHEFLSTTGNSNPLENSRRIGREMAQRLKDAGVDAVILTST
ncbi:MAG: glycine/betaine/sarcosine/D-proline family reductase selenoprotein B [Chloroflexi bacterium]|nr:glycine/betaine/sarcosine/D-proline family reductase selenoprotein B [Chloroflexota bacterium]